MPIFPFWLGVGDAGGGGSFEESVAVTVETGAVVATVEEYAVVYRGGIDVEAEIVDRPTVTTCRGGS